MENSLVTYEHLTWLVKKIIGNVTAKNYLKESLSILCFIIQGKGSSWKRFDPEILFIVIFRIFDATEFFLFMHAMKYRKGFLPLIANMLFVSKNCSLVKVAFMNSSCFIICELNWIVFMAIVKHFRVKMRLASFCCAKLIKYKYTFCLLSLLFSLTSNGVESHSNANGVLVHLMLFVSIKCFAGKGFCDIFCLCEL